MNRQLTSKMKLTSKSFKLRLGGKGSSKTNLFKRQMSEMLSGIAEMSMTVTSSQLPSTDIEDLSHEVNDPSTKIEEQSVNVGEPYTESNDMFSHELDELSPKIEEDLESPNVGQPDTELDDVFSPELNELSPKIEEATLQTVSVKLCFKEGRNVLQKFSFFLNQMFSKFFLKTKDTKQ